VSGSGELEDGGRGAAEPMVEEDHGSKASSTLTSSHAAITEVLCVCPQVERENFGRLQPQTKLARA
jgi:hypothetical protein